MKTKLGKEDKGKEQKGEKKKTQCWVGREMWVERVGTERAGKRKLI